MDPDVNLPRATLSQFGGTNSVRLSKAEKLEKAKIRAWKLFQRGNAL